MKITAATIIKIRNELGETQRQFGERFGVSQMTICNWETLGPPENGTARLLLERILPSLIAARA